MIERIQLIMKSRNISAAQFADEIGVQRSSVSHILTGRNNPSLDIILKILQRFPEINSDWILTGDGAMLKSGIGKSNKTQPAQNVINPSENINKQNNETLGDLFEQAFLKTEKRDSIDQPSTKQTVIYSDSELKEQYIEGEKIINSSEVVKQITSIKTVEQIVIFYSDKTFSYYTPNN